MARLPQPGSDSGTWGDILNDYLSQSHAADGSLKADSVTTTQIQDGTITQQQLDSAAQAKLNASGDWNTLTNKPAVVAAGATQAAARTAVGAFAASDVIDEDAMVSNSATKVPTQQSVKAYVDAQTGFVRSEIVLARGFAPQTFSNDTQFLAGTDVFIDTVDGPVDLTLDFGLMLFGPGTPGDTVEMELFIRNADTNETHAYNMFASPALQSNGFVGGKPASLTARIPKGTAKTHYVGVVSGTNTNNASPVNITLNPAWAPEGTAFVSMKAVRI